MYNGLLDSPALYNAGIYIRLSQEDKDKDKKYESESHAVCCCAFRKTPLSVR